MFALDGNEIADRASSFLLVQGFQGYQWRTVACFITLNVWVDVKVKLPPSCHVDLQLHFHKLNYSLHRLDVPVSSFVADTLIASFYS